MVIVDESSADIFGMVEHLVLAAAVEAHWEDMVRRRIRLHLEMKR